MSVDLPSSTLPQVLKRRISTGRGEAVFKGMETAAKNWASKVTGFFAIFHRGLGGLVVGA